MMKRFYYGAMATGLLFAACSSDNLSEPNPGNGVAEADQTLFVKMTIHGDVANGTRAASDNGNPIEGTGEGATTDFADGEGTESAVNNAYFVFYDGDGNVVGEPVNVPLDKPQSGQIGTTVETYYQNVVTVSLKKGELKPTQVICYINPVTENELKNPLSTVETITRQAVNFQATVTEDGKDVEKTFFPMSNSVYFQGNAGNPLIAVPVDNAQLFETEKEALEANEANQCVNVYVERYASKLKFSTVNKSEDYTAATARKNGEETTVVLSFTPERWALNGEATETYVVKSFRQPSATGTLLPTSYTYTELNNVINKGLTGNDVWAWNGSDYKRSYWGISPAYFTETYPEVADDVTELEAKNALHQKYYTRQELTRTTNALGFVPLASTDPNNKAQYFRETTIGSRALLANNPNAAIASVILVGKYSLTVGDNIVDGNPTFYTYGTGKNGNPLIYFDVKANASTDNPLESSVEDGVSMLLRFLEQTTVLYKNANYGKQDAEGNDLPANFVRLNVNVASDRDMMLAALEVADPDKSVLTTPGVDGKDQVMKIAARQRTLQLKSNANLNNLYIASGKNYNSIAAKGATAVANQVSFVEANKILIQNVGYANKYESGYAYFNIPVKHYGWYRPGNANRELKDGKIVDKATIDWTKVNVGDFGMVRNHSYDIVVSKIMGLGTGIGDGNDPIVPPAETKEYYVSYRINILRWAVVPQQNVEL